MADNKEKKSPGILKELIGWAIIIAVIFLSWQMFGKNLTSPDIMPYSTFIYNIEQGNIKSVYFEVSDYTQTGVVTTKDGKKFKTIAPLNDPNLYNLLVKSKVDYEFKASGNNLLTTILINVLPFAIIIILWIWMLQRIQASAGGGQAFTFGRSKAKLFLDNRPPVTFKNVAGLDEAKEEVGEVIEYLKNPKKFKNLGAKIPKGVILIGPPGCGKTLLARAIAGEAKVPFFNVSGSEFVEMFVGVGASRVRDLFDQAKSYSPCIIFIDEIDAVGRHRGAGIGGGHDEREQTLNQLLVEMDGFDPNKGIIVIAATNRPDILDPALLRPGRFDRRIVVDVPDARGREEILTVHAKDKPFAPEVNLQVIAKQTAGFTGADLENLLNESALLTARRNKKEIGMEEVEEAIDKVIAGPQKKSRVITPDERRRIAIHETGHAVVAKAIPGTDPVHRITIVSRGMALGYTLQLPTEDRYLKTKDELINEITSMLGGRASEEIFLDTASTGAANDLQRVTDIVHRMIRSFGMSEKLGPVTFGKVTELVFLGKEIAEERNYSEKTAQVIDEETRKIVEESYDIAKNIIKENKESVQKIVDMLLEKETLQGDPLNEILSGVKAYRSDSNKH